MINTIRNESELERLLQHDIDSTDKELRIFAGHLPLIYNDSGPGSRNVELGNDRWGNFSLYTFDIGARLLRYAIDSGREGKLIVLVDDDVELPRIEKNGRFVRQDKSWHKKPRQRLLENSMLPESYEQILQSYNLSYDDLITQERGDKRTVLLSEKKLKADAVKSRYTASNECSLAYKGLLLNPAYFDARENYLVSFMPGQCKGNICNGVLDKSLGIDATHIFFPHIETMGAILDMGNGFVKLGEVRTIHEDFSAGRITYRKDEA